MGPRLEGPGADADCGPGREPFSPPRPPVPATHLPWIKQTTAVQPEPFRLSFQLKRRSSRSKRWGKSDCISRATNPRPQGGRSSTLPTLEPVQPSSTEGNWLMGVTTRWSGWGKASGRPYSIPWGLWQVENAESPLEGIHGVALPGQVSGVVCLPAALVLAVQDKVLGESRHGRAPPCGAGTGTRILAGPSAGGAGSPSPASSGSTSLWAAALPPGPPGGG